VTPVSVNLPTNHINHQYNHCDAEASQISSLNHYFCRPLGCFSYCAENLQFHDPTYIQYFSLFRLQKYNTNNDPLPNYFLEQPNPYGQPHMHVILHKEGHPHLAHIHDVPPLHGKVFYLQTLLQHWPSSSYEDTQTVDGVEHDTYQEAATRSGLFMNEKEAKYALLEGIQTLKTPHQLCLLFVHLLVNDCIPTPMLIWDKLTHHLSFNHILQHNNVANVGVEYALHDLGNLPEPSLHSHEVEHELARWNADPDTLCTHANHVIGLFYNEQQAVYDDVMHTINNNQSLHIFVDRKAGTGKTYLLNMICDKVRSQGCIVFPMVITAFTALCGWENNPFGL
jgi:hypothetical protein